VTDSIIAATDVGARSNVDLGVGGYFNFGAGYYLDLCSITYLVY
jgi:hypothetical protein